MCVRARVRARERRSWLVRAGGPRLILVVLGRRLGRELDSDEAAIELTLGIVGHVLIGVIAGNIRRIARQAQ